MKKDVNLNLESKSVADSTIESEPEPEPESDLEQQSESELVEASSSKNLVNALRQANPKAIKHVYEVLGNQLVSLICKKGSSVFHANDILQETLITVLEKIEKNEYQEKGQFKSYFFRIGLNTYYKSIKQQDRRKIINTIYYERRQNLSDDTDVDESKKQHLHRQVIDIINQLPEEQRTLFHERVDKVPFKQLAEERGTTEAALKMKYRRIKDKIKRLIVQ